MNREEAKKILTHNWTRVDNPNYSESELDEAFFMAIEALSADRPSGKWQRVNEQPYFRKHYHKVCCSVCHKQGSEKYNYCPNCGTRMTPYKGGEDE